MDDIIVLQTPSFRRVYKKLFDTHQKIVDDAIAAIKDNPSLGEEKKGNLSGIFVYKFKIHNQEMLLAYRWNATKRILIALGVHENFYKNLSRNLQ